MHHAAALELKKPLRVNVFVGGPPAMAVAAVMPLPEGLSELAFAGALGGRRVPMVTVGEKLPIHAEADFCISGYIDPGRQLPEGPFGDHLGYYSLAHDFPVMIVERVYHRKDAIWPFTVVGRPPQEDSMFGALIHELVEPVVPGTIAGVRAVHAVEAAGVHPLLLAVGSERYVPYEGRQRPRELLTQSNALLGQGQLSLAKYLLIVAGEDNPGLDVRNVPDFFRHVLERVDWRRDLHFQTCTTIDTLDYSGDGLNQGSKVVVAAAGPPLRTLPVALDSRLTLPEELGFQRPMVFLPGILVVQGPAWERGAESAARGSGERGAGSGGGGGPDRGPLLPDAEPPRHDQQFSAGGGGRSVGVRRPEPRQLSLDHLHAEQSGHGHLRHRGLYPRQALGMFRLAGDRCPGEAAPCPAADRRPRRDAARSTPWRPPAGRCTGSFSPMKEQIADRRCPGGAGLHCAESSRSRFCPGGRGFSDVTASSGVDALVDADYQANPKVWLSGIDLVDLDGDGKLDLFLSAHGQKATAPPGRWQGPFHGCQRHDSPIRDSPRLRH